jgi:uncharacterized protein (DUF697 family)
MSEEAQVETAEAVEAPELTDAERLQAKARTTIRKYAAVSAGLGFIPVPGLDVASISSVQYSLIRDLAELYGYSASKEQVRVILASLLGGAAPVVLTAAGLGSAVKALPFVGTIAGMVVMPSLAAASTLAVGRVFNQHFASGGTLLNFDAEKMREHFKAEFEAAQLK